MGMGPYDSHRIEDIKILKDFSLKDNKSKPFSCVLDNPHRGKKANK